MNKTWSILGSGLARRRRAPQRLAGIGAAAVVGALTLTAQAQWRVVNLHPAGASESYAYGVHGGQQVGTAWVRGTYRASLWRGTADSWVNLTPNYQDLAEAYGVHGGQQVGAAREHGYWLASLWTGTADSWVSLHPAGASESWAYGVHGGQQVGTARVRGTYRASLWTGSAGSWVNLHAFLPADFSMSVAHGIWNDRASTNVVGWGFNTSTNRSEALMWVGRRCAGDLNGDGRTDLADLTILLGCFRSGDCGDLDDDGDTDLADMSILIADFGCRS